MAETPYISVLMPLFNAERYLSEAVKSILEQTRGDFELIVIDDGSTDCSAEIVRAFADPRILFFSNGENRGIVSTLNRGISLARGRYIAIMHADDMSLPDRLGIQAEFLDTHKDVAAVAARATLIDGVGRDLGVWEREYSRVTCEAIREALPEGNCLMHPSVMIRREIAMSYKYEDQKATEDYDLWLRLVADGHQIGKVDQVLLRYRVHPTSITARSNRDAWKEIRTKWRFILRSAAKRKSFTSLHKEVIAALFKESLEVYPRLLRESMLAVARAVCSAVGYPLGAMYSMISRGHKILFFFPFPLEHIGGSERVHRDVLESASALQPWVVLANESYRRVGKPPAGTVSMTDISHLLRNPVTKNIAIGFFAGYCNSTRCAVVGGNCEFFYLLLRKLDPSVKAADIVHSHDEIMSEISVAHVTRLNLRMVITEEIRLSLVELYSKHGIPAEMASRIELVDYFVNVPNLMPVRTADPTLKVLFVGRGCVEKRVHLVGRIAFRLSREVPPVKVLMAGDVAEYVDEGDRPACSFLGPLVSTALDEAYRMSDILLITSRTEGLCLVNLEAMANGVVPIAVAVGGIPWHVRHGVTGFLVPPEKDEEGVVNEFVALIRELNKDRNSLARISRGAYDHAKNNFNRDMTFDQFAQFFSRLTDV